MSETLPSVPGPTGPNLEQTKVLLDVSKHLTSVATASLLLLVTFREKLAVPGESRLALAIAFLGFTVAVTSAVFCQGYLVEDFLGKESDRVLKARRAFGTSFIAFGIGIITLTIFGLWHL